MRLDDRELTYRELELTGARTAALLRSRGVRPGHRVGLMLPNVPELAIVHEAIGRLGGVVVALAPGLDEHEVARRLVETEAGSLVAWHASAEAAEAGALAAGVPWLGVAPGEFSRLLRGQETDTPPAPAVADEPAVVPAGAVRPLSRRDVATAVAGAVAAQCLDGEDVVVAAVPLVEALGRFFALESVLAVGACLSLLDGAADAARVLAALRRDRASVLHARPALLRAVADAVGAGAPAPVGLRACMWCDDPPPDGAARAIERTLGCAVLVPPRAS